MAESPTARLNILQGLEDLTECSIHCGTYENPRQLPCLHSFCLQCLVNYTKDKPLTSNITCPLCRKEITVPDDGIEGFPRNFFIDKIIEIKKLTGPLQKDTLCDICQEDEDTTSDDVPVASMFCAECRRNLCERCRKEHQRHNKSHTVLKLGSEEINEQLLKKLEVSFCSDHSGKSVEMFCFDCQVVICIICFIEKHKLHNCSDINKTAKDFRKQMEFEINAISVCLSEGEKRIEMIAKMKDDFLQGIQSVEEKIMDRSVKLKRIIDRDRNLLLDELKIIKSSHLKEIQVKDDEIQKQLTIIASLKTYGKEIVAVGSASDICGTVNQFSIRTKEVQATSEEAPFCEVVDTTVSFQSTDVKENLGRNILGRLEVNCQKVLVKDLSDPEKSLQKTNPGIKEASMAFVEGVRQALAKSEPTYSHVHSSSVKDQPESSRPSKPLNSFFPQNSFPTQGQATGHQGPMDTQQNYLRGLGQATSLQNQRWQQNSLRSLGQATGLQGQRSQQNYLQGQGQAASQRCLQNFPPGQGQATGLMYMPIDQTTQQNYLQGQGQITRHQAQTTQPSYSMYPSQVHVPNYQENIQPFTYPD